MGNELTTPDCIRVQAEGSIRLSVSGPSTTSPSVFIDRLKQISGGAADIEIIIVSSTGHREVPRQSPWKVVIEGSRGNAWRPGNFRDIAAAIAGSFRDQRTPIWFDWMDGVAPGSRKLLLSQCAMRH